MKLPITITKIRPMTESELGNEWWHSVDNTVFRDIPALELDDGTILYPASNAKGDAAGALFGLRPDGTPFDITEEMG